MAIRWIIDGSESDLDVGDSTLGTRLIKLRNPLVRGDDVKELQELLTALGYAPGEIDGYYGVKTAAAVKEFQRATGGLEVDGDYGPLTHAALMDAVSALEGEASEDEPSADAPADTEDVPMVVITGILGAVAAPLLIRVFRVKNPIAAGVGLGAASHAVGTSKALELGEVQGAMSGISLSISGILTVLISLFLPR